MKEKQGVLIANTLILAIGGMSVQLMSFLLLPLYTKYLSKSDYGAVDVIQSYGTIIAPLIMLQIGMSVFQYMIDARGDQKKMSSYISTTLAFSISVISVCALIALPLVILFNIHLGLLSVAAILLAAIQAVLGQLVRGIGDNKLFAFAGVVSGVAGVLSGLYFIIVRGMGAEGLLASMALGSFVSVALYLMRLFRSNYISVGGIERRTLRKLLKYSLPLVPATLSWWLIGAADRTIIALSMGAEANGIYAIAMKFSIIYMTIYSFFNMSWVESVGLHIDSEGSEEFFSRVCSASVKLFGALAAGAIAVVPVIFGALINVQFLSAYELAPLLIVATLCNVLIGNYTAIYLAKKDSKSTARTAIVAAAINILVSVSLIASIGLFAPALASILGYAAMVIYRHYDVKKYVAITYEPLVFVKVFGLIAFASMLFYINIFWLNIVNLLFVAVCAVWLNRSFTSVFKEKILEIHKKFRKHLKPEYSPDLQL